ncbi:glycosyltransferase family 25 protein [Plesiomonas shigelloides]|uniref:glycosyltransferase family 25 protein n=1 Tax=Plesiomonas shigelloides TaxID=703 RepID=UPI0022453FF5|nr:glycosyltransferase family 25 protein [Plesiomonas shigelloides]MCX2534400.1 glycosyltransferase family 25 protein [Plesiomonas shigelloides]
MKTIVVSLNNSERRVHFDKNFSDINYEYFNAISPKDNDPRFDQFIARSLYGRKLRKGEVGCTLSHFEIINKFSVSNDNSDWVLIMEDDALPEPGFKKFIDYFHNNADIPSGTPLVLLLGHSKTSKNKLFFQRLTQPLVNTLIIDDFVFGENKNISFCGTVCYMINKCAAKILAECKIPYWMADDWSLFHKLGITVLHPVKPLIYEDLNYASSTGNIIFHQHDFFKRPKLTIKEIIIGRCKFYNNYH